MGKYLTNAFAAVVLTSAVSTAAVADNDGMSASKATLQNNLNLRASNSFYHAGASLRIDENCKVKGDQTICHMTLINGQDLRALEARLTYKADKHGNLTEISHSLDKTQFYTASGAGARRGKVTNTAEGDQYDERLVEASQAHHAGTRTEAKGHGFGSAKEYTISRMGEYKIENGTPTEIGKALLKNNDPAYGGTFRLLDGVTRLTRTGDNSISERTCKLIPVAGAEVTNFDVDMPESFRALCVGKEFNLGADVTTTYTIHGLTAGGELQQASFTDKREMGSLPNAEIGLQDHKHYKQLSEDLGRKVSTNILSSAL